MTRDHYPHTIDNGAGERLTFVRRVAGQRGDRIEAESTVTSPGAGPPMHAHLHQEEGFTVLEGRIGYQRGTDAPQFASPGESVVFRMGEPHKFWNAGDGPLRFGGYIEPADNAEYFLTALFDSTKRAGGRRPDLFEAAFLTRRYRSEFVMLEIPTAVQRVVFPVLVLLGHLLGKYKRYADAPAPLHR
jgi:quercetin dioxygenase-like cupin family protein